jgi:hypothetical protein
MSDVSADLVEVGMSVLALDLNDDTDADLADVRGGVVVAIETAVDPDTGELQCRFVTAKQWRRQIRWSALRADEVRQVVPFDSAAVRRLIRAMARTVAEGKGVILTDDRRLVDAMAVLARTT